MTSSQTIASLVEAAKPADLPALAGDLARALGVVLARAATTPVATSPALSENAEAGVLLTVEEAGQRLGVASNWLYRHAKSLPFTRKLGRRTLRFDAHGLERWAANRPRT